MGHDKDILLPVKATEPEVSKLDPDNVTRMPPVVEPLFGVSELMAGAPYEKALVLVTDCVGVPNVVRTSDNDWPVPTGRVHTTCVSTHV